MIGGKDDREGRKRYKEFVIDRISKDMNITFWKEVKGQVVSQQFQKLAMVLDRLSK